MYSASINNTDNAAKNAAAYVTLNSCKIKPDFLLPRVAYSPAECKLNRLLYESSTAFTPNPFSKSG